VPDQEEPATRDAPPRFDGEVTDGEVSAEVAQLLRAVESRDIIGQAKGILMERYKVSADEAFDKLRQASQQSNRKLVELARVLAETGEWPVTTTEGA